MSRLWFSGWNLFLGKGDERDINYSPFNHRFQQMLCVGNSKDEISDSTIFFSILKFSNWSVPCRKRCCVQNEIDQVQTMKEMTEHPVFPVRQSVRYSRLPFAGGVSPRNEWYSNQKLVHWWPIFGHVLAIFHPCVAFNNIFLYHSYQPMGQMFDPSLT